MARLEPAIASGSLLKLYQALWGPYYEAALRILGSTGTILALGDPAHGQPNAATFTTKGAEQATFTWSEAPSAFDTALDLTDPDSYQGIMPVVTFNGTDEEADTPDAAYWSPGDGSNDTAFSLGIWVNLLTDPGTFLARWDSSANEWLWHITSAGIVRLLLRDLSGPYTAQRETDAFVSLSAWHHLVATYDGAGGAAAADTIKLYVDGTAVASTATNNASYVAMQNEAGTTTLGVTTTSIEFLDGRVAGGPLGPSFTQTELTADEVRALYDLGRAGLGL